LAGAVTVVGVDRRVCDIACKLGVVDIAEVIGARLLILQSGGEYRRVEVVLDVVEEGVYFIIVSYGEESAICSVSYWQWGV